MKKIFKCILFAGLFMLCLTGCEDEGSVTPSEITDLASATSPGAITLNWDTPRDGTIEYIRVTYYDPRLKKEVVRLASVFANRIEIPDTRARYPEYEFTVRTVSPTGDMSAPKKISQKSDPAEIITQVAKQEIMLSAADLSTNAQEPSEGPIANLLDNNKDTFFHTQWSGGGGPAPIHWMDVNLKRILDDHYSFYYAPRKNGANKPTDVDLLGSTDGENWELIKNFTQEDDGLPVTSTDDYTSEVLKCPFPFSRIRFSVNATNTGTKYWTMSIFKFYTVTVKEVNPETDEED